MTAPTKSWVNIADSAIDPDSPLDTALMTALRDNDIHLRDVLFGSYTAGVQMDHNHDGVNSALVEIGPNAIRNGSFEDGTTGWTLTQYTGGTIATNTANDMDGATALAVTSTSTANGGGDALSNEFRPCTGGSTYGFGVVVKASVANVSSKAQVVWYDADQAQISTDDIYSSSSTSTTADLKRSNITAPSTARYYKVKLIGGVPGVGSATGSIYFDGVFANGIQDTDAYSVGGYIIGRPANATNYPAGTTIAGSSLYMTPGHAAYNGGWGGLEGPTLVTVGTWRCTSIAYGNNTVGYTGLWARIA